MRWHRQCHHFLLRFLQRLFVVGRAGRQRHHRLVAAEGDVGGLGQLPVATAIAAQLLPHARRVERDLQGGARPARLVVEHSERAVGQQVDAIGNAPHFDLAHAVGPAKAIDPVNLVFEPALDNLRWPLGLEAQDDVDEPGGDRRTNQPRPFEGGIDRRQPGQVRLHRLERQRPGLVEQLGCHGPVPARLPRREDGLEQLVVHAAALERRQRLVVVAFLGEPKHVARVELERTLRVELERAHRACARRLWPGGAVEARQRGGHARRAQRRPLRRLAVERLGEHRACCVGAAAREPAKARASSWKTRTSGTSSGMGVRPARPMSSSRLDGSTSASSSSENVETETCAVGDCNRSTNAARAGASASGCSAGQPSAVSSARRIEDVAALAAWPLAVDQPHQVQGVEAAEGRGGGVNQLHAGLAGIGREGLALDPMAQVGGQVAERPQQVVMRAVRLGESTDDGSAPPAGRGAAAGEARRRVRRRVRCRSRKPPRRSS